MKINKAKTPFTGHSPRHTQAATAGHTEGNKPKLGEDNGAAKGGVRNPMDNLYQNVV
jgi:hypothetical protein